MRGISLYLLHELQNVLKAALSVSLSLEPAADFPHDPVLLLVPLDVLGRERLSVAVQPLRVLRDNGDRETVRCYSHKEHRRRE